MTKHRSKEEWISEILSAAADEIDENGYSEFSMEAIVRRTGLSKGGIYRFYKNRADVALDVFSSTYRKLLDFDMDSAVSWNLPLDETIFKLILRYNIDEDEARKYDRIWVKLVPEVLVDERFKEARSLLLQEIKIKMLELISRIAERDKIEFHDEFDDAIVEAFSMMTGLLEGFAVQSALGASIELQANQVRQFISGVVEFLLTGKKYI